MQNNFRKDSGIDRAKMGTKFCLTPKLRYLFIHFLEAELLAGGYSMLFSNIGCFSWNATLTCSLSMMFRWPSLPTGAKSAFSTPHRFSAMVACGYTEAEWDAIFSGPRQPLMFKSYS